MCGGESLGINIDAYVMGRRSKTTLILYTHAQYHITSTHSISNSSYIHNYVTECIMYTIPHDVIIIYM